MKNKLNKICGSAIKLLFGLTVGMTLFTSCEEEYQYANEEPAWLGGSIYEYLNDHGKDKFSTYVRLIDDLGYKEVLNLTGSKTLFVATDSAFTEFYKNNPWGVTSYEQLTQAQKKQIFYYSMINNAYLLERLSNYYDGNFHEGSAMRRMTALSALDSIPFVKETLPSGVYWDHYKEKGMYLMKDNTDLPLVFFSPQFIERNAVTSEDFSFVSGGNTRGAKDFYVFNKKVVQGDIVCKNGYIHVLEEVLLPPVNMAEYIATNPKTTIFSKLLDRFSAPYYDNGNTKLYHELHPEFTDSIFYKGYLANIGGLSSTPDGKQAPYKLPFNPGRNTLSNGTIYADIASMFVPTDEVMNNYFNNDPTGSLLKIRYGDWDHVPDDVALSFLRRHMRNSLVESLPSRFSKMVDEQNYRLPVVKEDIIKEENYTAVNGEVYLTNRVYTPVDFISVYGPVLLNESTKIMNWVISRTVLEGGVEFAFYKLYLNSLVVNYGLLAPTDKFFSGGDGVTPAYYIDPVAYGQTGTQGALKFWFNEQTQAVNATVYSYSKTTHTVGDSVNIITNVDFLKDRLWKLLDSHIVVGDISGDGYYVTKANDIIKVSGDYVQGGNDMLVDHKIHVDKRFFQKDAGGNGTTYLLNAPIGTSLNSAYSVLADTLKEEFSDFFDLLNEVPSEFSKEIPQIFVTQGVDKRVRFFNAYNYTIYVPSNEAVQRAIAEGIIKPWSQINAISDAQLRKAETRKLVSLLRYHFQDKAIFVGQSLNGEYQSSTLKTDNDPTHWGTQKNKYYKLGINSEGNSFTITTEVNKTARVLLRPGYYNIVSKDYVFAKLPTEYKNVDGSGATTVTSLFADSRISTSSSAVIHLIDNVLTFK